MKYLFFLLIFFCCSCSHNLPSFRSNEDRCFDICYKSIPEDDTKNACVLSRVIKGGYMCDCACKINREGL
jgi:hypothetical protein